MSGLLNVDSELKTKVEAFRQQITAEAENLVASFFPQKLIELDKLLKETILNLSDLKQIHSEIRFTVPDPLLITNSHDGLYSKTKTNKLEGAVTQGNLQGGTRTRLAPDDWLMSSNGELMELMDRVKPEIRTLIEKCNTVKMWIQLLIPRIEDGNNFGVSIQEETVAELRTVESEALSYLDHISKFFMSRAQLVSKITKYPHVEDYRRAVSEIEEKEYINLRIIVSELRNQYVILHDMILKNIEKIKKPRSYNADSLY